MPKNNKTENVNEKKKNKKKTFLCMCRLVVFDVAIVTKNYKFTHRKTKHVEGVFHQYFEGVY
jgi:hypothetical protein